MSPAPAKPQTSSSTGSIPMRKLGRHDQQISALGLGGHHLGAAEDLQTATRIVQEAIDGGITFFDNCWEYHHGKIRRLDGHRAKRPPRQSLSHDQSLHSRPRSAPSPCRCWNNPCAALQTDHLDLWQIHGVGFDNDPELFIRPNGAAEALHKAKEQGKVRFTGFTGHKDPAIHLKMLANRFPLRRRANAPQPFDRNFLSFELECPARTA